MAWLNQNDLHLPWCLPFIISHFNDSSFLRFAYRRKATVFLSELNEKLYSFNCCLYSVTWDCIKISINITTSLKVIFLPNLLCCCLWLRVTLKQNQKKERQKKKLNHSVFLGLLLRVVAFICFQWELGSNKFSGYILGLSITSDIRWNILFR